ncbi:hypothetical protein D3C81_2101090 [compost metagenome]
MFENVSLEPRPNGPRFLSSGLCVGSQLFQCRLQGQSITAGAQTTDHPYGNIGKVGVMTERFAFVHVGEVHFDEWDAHRKQCVT